MESGILETYWKKCSHRCKGFIAKILYVTGLTHLLLWIVMQGRGRVVILLYHRVNSKSDEYNLALSIKSFEQQMELISRVTRVIPLKKAVAELSNGRDSNNAVVVTIDDSHVDTFDNMYKVFKERNIPATVFLNTGQIESKNPLWHVSLAEMFKKSQAKYLRMNLGQKDHSFFLTDREDKLRAFQFVKEYSKRLQPAQRESLFKKLAIDMKAGFENNNTKLNLSWQQIREMTKEISFGAHTHTHPILSSLNSNMQEQEIRTSKEMIENNLDQDVRFFAYPNGRREDFDNNSKAELKKLGFSCALTTEEGCNMRGDNLFELRRTYTTEESIERFALHLLRTFLKRRK